MSGSLPTSEQVEAVLGLLGEEDTAVQVVDFDLLARQLDHLAACFGDRARHAVAIKTMPHEAVLTWLVGRGCSLEAASFEEVVLALRAGALPERIVWDSPAKTKREIARAEELAPGLLANANSLAELERYRPDSPLRLGLRINPELRSGAPSAYDVGGPGSRFGAPLSKASEILEVLRDRPVVALHVHIGSRVPTTDAHVDAIERVVELADAIEADRRAHGIELAISTIDVGGGLQADARAVGDDGRSIVAELAGRLAGLEGMRSRELLTEFGQWTHAHAGWTASRVEQVTTSAPRRAQLHVGADLFVREAYAGLVPHPYAVRRSTGELATEAEEAYELDGPLCFAGDVIGHEVPLPRMVEGDWLVIGSTGANTLGLWSRHCSRDVPAVVGLESGEARLLSGRRPVA